MQTLNCCLEVSWESVPPALPEMLSPFGRLLRLSVADRRAIHHDEHVGIDDPSYTHRWRELRPIFPAQLLPDAAVRA